MDFIPELLYSVAPYVHFIAFGLLMLAGLNLPVSEDIVFIVSASIAATIVPQNTPLIFAGCFAGAYASDIVAYLIGRYFIGGFLIKHPAVKEWRIVKLLFGEKNISRLEEYFNKYGSKTLFFGRFVPGIRNLLFMTCGLTKMKMPRFLIIDICALCCTSAILFSIGYNLGENYDIIFPWLDKYKIIILIIFIAAMILLNRKKIAALFAKYTEKKAKVGEHFTSKLNVEEEVSEK